MTTGADILVNGFERIKSIVERAVAGLTPEQLSARVDPGANSIAWLIWHLTRVQDDHVANAAGIEQQWLANGWCDRFALPFDRTATGNRQTSEEVAAVKVSSGDLLTDYHRAVCEQTLRFVTPLDDADLLRVVDESYDPPVLLRVRLVSVLSDNLQHAGQAGFVRGLIQRH